MNLNLHNVFEELNKLYESFDEKKDVEELVNEEPVAEQLNEAAEDEEIEIVDEESAEEEPEAEEVVEEPVEDVQDEETKMLVIECSNCGGVYLKAETDVVIDEESDLANVEEPCQYCEAAEGYKVLGALAPYGVPVDEGEVAEEVEDSEEAVEAEDIEDDEIEESLEEGIFDNLFGGDKKKQQQFNMEIKKALGKGVTEIVNEVSGACTSLLYACVSEAENEPALINQVTTQLTRAIENAKHTPNAAVHAVMNVGRQYAFESLEFEQLQEKMKVLDRVREIPKIGQKATGYLFDQINAKVVPVLDKAIKNIKASN